MEQSFWWYLLAGIILGFIISTLWEWLYFRRRRLVLTDRRIAELEAALRTANRTQQERSLESAEAWPASSYRSPDVFLESEAPQPIGSGPEVKPSPQRVTAATAAVTVAPVPVGNDPATPIASPAPAAERISASGTPTNGQHAKPAAGVSAVAVAAARPVESHAPEVTADEIKQLAASIHALLDEMSGGPGQ
jgi:hypothetical protein